MPFDLEASETEQIFVYEQQGDSAVILRCFSRADRAVIPQRVHGLTVKRIAPYAFSAHMDAAELERKVQSGEAAVVWPAFLEKKEGLPELPALCGTRLEKIEFPESVTGVGAYCFYNCSRLHSLSFTGKLKDWGNGVFTGCHQIRTIRVLAAEDGTSSLKEAIDEVREEVCVEYREAGGNRQARLIFPEFYEEGVENTPARILETHVHGSGMRYRNCFQNKKIDFHQYDLQFLYAKAQESGRLAAQLAMNRLRFPYQLSEQARSQYVDYVIHHPDQMAELLTSARDIEGIRWIFTLFPSQSEGMPFIERLTEYGGREKFAEALGYAMEFQRTHRTEKPGRRRFEL